MDESLEKSAMRKIYFRLLPFLLLAYILAYIDRINVSFAALTMQGDLKMTAGGPAPSASRPAPSTGATSSSRCRATSSSRKWARASGSPAS